jgi:predicted PurR-regulated permease PerM
VTYFARDNKKVKFSQKALYWESKSRVIIYAQMQREILQRYFLLALLSGSLFLAVLIIIPFFAPLALAAVATVIIYPLYSFFLRKVRGRQNLAVFITMLLVIVCIVVPLFFLGVRVFHESQGLYSSLSQGDGLVYLDATIGRVQNVVGSYLPNTGTTPFTLSENIDAYTKQGLSLIISHLGDLFSSITSLLVGFFIFLIALYYLLRDGAKLKQIIIKLSPLADTDDEAVFKRLEIAVNSVIKGTLTVAIIQGVLATIGFLIFGVPNAILWGTVTVLSALIPAVGTSLVLIPGIIYLFLFGSTFQAVGLLIWSVLAVGIVDNIVGPKLVGKGAALHPLLVMLSVLGGIAFFGPIGIFLGPLVVSLFLAFVSIYSKVA